MLVELLVLVAIVLVLYRRWAKRDVYNLGKQLNSGVRTFPFIGHSYLFVGNNHTRMKAFQILGRDALNKENGLASMWHGNYLYTMIANPAAAEFVLKTCLEKDDMMKVANYFIGNGSIFASVPIWRPRRKILNQNFTMKKLKYFMSIFIKQSGILVEEMGKMAGTGPLSAWNYFTAYTMDVATESALGYKIGAQKNREHPFLKAFETALARVADRICQPWLHSDLVYNNLPVYSKQVKTRKLLWDFLSKLILNKREDMKQNNTTTEQFETRMKAFQILGRDALNKENGLASMWHGNYLYTMIANPAAAEFVLKTCLEKDDMMKVANYFIGNGSIFASVPIWRPRRKILNQNFTMKKLKYFMSIFIKQSGILVEEMGKMAGTGPLSAWNYFTAYTMDVATESALGYKIGAQKNREHPFLKAFETALARVADRICQPWLHSDLVYNNLPVYSKQVKTRKLLWDFLSKLILNKREDMKQNNTTTEQFENSSDDTPKTFLESLILLFNSDNGYTDVEIREELMVLLLASTDTSAVGASFTSVMLSRHPEVQEKVYKELQEVFGDSDRPVTFEDLIRLKYLDAVIRETLRLYPPVPIITRKIVNSIVLPTGIKLVSGTGVMVNVWAIHRNPQYWGDDAELFRPERFIDTPLTHPAAFMPFSYGVRNCIGYQYAMLTMKTVVSSLLRSYKILPATAPNSNSEYPPLQLTFGLMMKDKDRFQIQIESRH